MQPYFSDMHKLEMTATNKEHGPMNPNYSYTKNEVLKELYWFSYLTTEYNKSIYDVDVPVRTTNKRHGSYFKYDVNKNDFQIGVGTNHIFRFAQGEHARNRDFVKAIKSIMHEEQHLHQHKVFFQRENPNEITKTMNIQNVICSSFPEYYEACYFQSNLSEIYAERNALIRTMEYFKLNHPEINVEKELVDTINCYQSWYADHPVTSVQDAIDKLTLAFNTAKEKPVNLYKVDFQDREPSPAFQAFFKDHDLDEYNHLSSEEQRTVLLEFIAQNAPSKISGYKTLSDVPIAQGEDKISVETDTRPFRPLPDLSSIKFEKSNELELK